jgi:CBS domain-containing protein
MTLMNLVTPIARVAWLSTTDTVRDAFDHLETHELSAAPLLDWTGKYVGTITEADLRRHVASAIDRVFAMATPLRALERRAKNPPVMMDRGVSAIATRAVGHGFIPVIDGTGRLVGVIDRRKIVDRSAA